MQNIYYSQLTKFCTARPSYILYRPSFCINFLVRDYKVFLWKQAMMAPGYWEALEQSKAWLRLLQKHHCKLQGMICDICQCLFHNKQNLLNNFSLVFFQWHFVSVHKQLLSWNKLSFFFLKCRYESFSYFTQGKTFLSLI